MQARCCRSSSGDLRAPHHLDACLAHFLDRCGDVAALKLDAAATVLDQRDAETELSRVERGELHAVIGRQAEKVDLARAASLQVVAQTRRLAVTVVEEPAVAVDA